MEPKNSFVNPTNVTMISGNQNIPLTSNATCLAAGVATGVETPVYDVKGNNFAFSANSMVAFGSDCFIGWKAPGSAIYFSEFCNIDFGEQNKITACNHTTIHGSLRVSFRNCEITAGFFLCDVIASGCIDCYFFFCKNSIYNNRVGVIVIGNDVYDLIDVVSNDEAMRSCREKLMKELSELSQDELQDLKRSAHSEKLARKRDYAINGTKIVNPVTAMLKECINQLVK